MQVPQSLNKIYPSKMMLGKKEPVFKGEVNQEWFAFRGVEADCVQKAHAADLAFVLRRQESTKRVGWTLFSKNLTTRHLEMSAIGYMPLILNPAHELDTLVTVLERSISVADRLGENYVVLTADQALYCKLIELRWFDERYQDRIILKMGGLHIALNFQKAIGQQMQASGLSEVWTESGVVGEGAASLILNGKSYAKAMRVHKLTYKALWQLLLPAFLAFVENKDPELAKMVSEECKNPEILIDLLTKHHVTSLLREFSRKESEKDVNFSFWWQYLEMISTLLLFTRSLRDGLWEPYLEAIVQMLPYFMRYDHLNYAKSVPVFIADMMTLPEEVHSKFLQGDFVVKRSNDKFNQVDADYAQEWIVGTGKESGGVVGITNEISAVQRWALSFHWRSEVATKTYTMFDLDVRTATHNELNSGRPKRDEKDENSLVSTLKRLTSLQQSLMQQF